MSWFCIEITEACVLEGAYHRLCRQFQQAFISAGAPKEMALFAETFPDGETRKLYLSPGSLLHVQSILDEYLGSPCERPAADGLTLIFGVPDAKWHLLEDEAEREVGRSKRFELLPATLAREAAPLRAAVGAG